MLNSIFKRKEDEDRLRDDGRLPPGQSLTQKFPVLHYGPVPGFNPATWDFRVWGEVSEERQWTWDEFNQLPRTKILMDIHCVTRWSKFDTEWEGVSVKIFDRKWINIFTPRREVCPAACRIRFYCQSSPGDCTAG